MLHDHVITFCYVWVVYCLFVVEKSWNYADNGWSRTDEKGICSHNYSFLCRSVLCYNVNFGAENNVLICEFCNHDLNKKAQLSLTNPRDVKACQNCSNSTCLQRCRWQYWPIFMRLTAIASEICEIPRNSLKIQTYGVQGHPRSSILVPFESPYTTCY